ncbi:MAG: flagellar motor stator protein MotA [Rickettsia sp.]|nr:flagellar motor stator protein MotA [Rickettsia sp.]
MLFFLGIFVLFFSVGFGYVWGHGSLILLWQPSEYLIILGSGVASIMLSNPFSNIVTMLKSLRFLFKNAPYDKRAYLNILKFLGKVFKKIKAEGVIALEKELDDGIIVQEIEFIQDKSVKDFITDALRLLIIGVKERYAFEDLLDTEILLFKKDLKSPSKIFETLADSLPALGIVAAVLGVIVSMKSIAEPPEVLGAMIAAALVGTFSGIFFAYGMFGPMGEYLNKYSDYELIFLDVIKKAFVAHLEGYSSLILIEIIRKAIPIKIRPSFEEVEEFISN